MLIGNGAEHLGQIHISAIVHEKDVVFCYRQTISYLGEHFKMYGSRL